MRGWFLSDLGLVIVDIFAIVVVPSRPEESACWQHNSMVSLLRSARFFRLLSLLRVLRFRRIVEIITRGLDSVGSQMGFVIARLAGLLICILLLNHYIACSWYAVGRYEQEVGSRTWLVQCDASTSWGHYACALHWSLTQFTPATQNLTPVSSEERWVC